MEDRIADPASARARVSRPRLINVISGVSFCSSLSLPLSFCLSVSHALSGRIRTRGLEEESGKLETGMPRCSCEAPGDIRAGGLSMCNRAADRAMYECIGNSTRSRRTLGRDGLRQCRHERQRRSRKRGREKEGGGARERGGGGGLGRRREGECTYIYASRLNKIKETPAHPHAVGAASGVPRGSGSGRFKNTARETAAEFPPCVCILPG